MMSNNSGLNILNLNWTSLQVTVDLQGWIFANFLDQIKLFLLVVTIHFATKNK